MFRCGMAMGNVEVIQVMNNVKAPYNLSKLASNMAHKAFDNLDVLEANIDKVLKVSTQGTGGEGRACPLQPHEASGYGAPTKPRL